MRIAPRLLKIVLLSASFLASVLPAVAAPACNPLKGVASLDMMPLPSGRPSVEVKIADSPRTMLLDTGGAVGAVTRDTVEDLRLGVVQNGMAIRGVNGVESNLMAQIPSIVIGNLFQNNALYYVLPRSNAAGAGEFDGILAGEFLKQYDADFDFVARKLNLFSQDHCAGQVVYWMPQAVAVVPMQIDRDNHIRFRVELDGKKVDAILDTGAATTFLNLLDAQRLFRLDVKDLEKVGELTGARSANLYRVRLKTLAFEGVTISNPEVILLPDMMTDRNELAPKTNSLISARRPAPAVTVGMSILSKLHVYIAYKERKLYITAAGPSSTGAQPPPQ